jgi:hypothetical protein
MNPMTLGQIQTMVVQLTKESTPSNPTFATLANVTTYANEAQSKIMRRTRNRVKSNFPNLPGGTWTANQYQRMKFDATPTSGAFTVRFNGQTTASQNAATTTAATLQTALSGLSSVGTGNVTVTGNNADGYLVIFNGGFIGITTIPLMTLPANTCKEIMGNLIACTVTGVTAGDQDAADRTVVGHRLYSLPSDFLQMEKVSINNVPCKVARLSDISQTLMWHRLPGWPTNYYFERDQFTNTYKLGLWLRPSSVWPLGYEYVPLPVAMSASTDYPDLEEFLHPAVVHYTCQRIMEYRREYQKAQYWANEYEKDLRDYESSGQDTDEAIQMLTGPRPTD